MSSQPQVGPFPWETLASTTRARVAAFRAARRWAAANADPGELAAAFSELLGVRVELLVRGAEPLVHPQGLVGGAGVAVAVAEHPSMDHAALVEAEGALVAAIVARVVRRAAPAIRDPGVTASSAAAGAFGAVLSAGLRRANAGIALRVLAAGPADALEGDLASSRRDLVAMTLTVLLGDDAYEARVVVPAGALSTSGGPPWGATALEALGSAPLSIPLVAHAVLATTAEVASLAQGDALVLEGWPLSGGPGTLEGTLRLAPPTSSWGVTARLAGDGRVVLAGEVEPLVAAEAEMSEATDRTGIIEAIGEVPVVVRVELGEATMPAREWALLAKGDVVTLGRRLGESVTLRVGGVPVARGDLVEVDGEVGVRIVERLSGGEGRR
ncbi:MAG TPA: FliM/FliN family flagellar motor switch protein [Polyangiaceae bacterium]